MSSVLEIKCKQENTFYYGVVKWIGYCLAWKLAGYPVTLDCVEICIDSQNIGLKIRHPLRLC